MKQPQSESQSSTESPSPSPSASSLERLRTDDRAVSEILGAILLFGVLIALVVLVQVTAVPAWNQQAEFEHNQRVQEDIGDLGDAIQRVRAGDAAESVSVELGVDYPFRLFLLNPPAATGQLRTVERGQFVIANAEAVDAETRDYWTGTRTVAYDTKGIRYSPNYNEYRSAPDTLYEHGLVFNRWDDNVTTLEQANQLISGDDINVVALTGSLDRSGTEPTSVEVSPSSTDIRTVSMRGDEAGAGSRTDIVLSFRTTLSAEKIRRVFGNETHLVEPPRYEPNPDGTATVTLTLDGDVTYDVRTAKVAVGETASSEPASYLTAASDTSRFIPVGSSGVLTTEARTKFNAPKSGVTVEYTVLSGGGRFIDPETGATVPSTVTTDDDGKAPVAFAPTANGTTYVQARAELNGQSGYQDEETVVYAVSTTLGAGTDGTGDDTGINPVGTKTVVQWNSAIVSAAQGTVDVRFRNLGDQTRTWSRVRINFYAALGASTPPDRADLYPPGSTATSVGSTAAATNLEVGGGFKNVSIAFPPHAGNDANDRTVRFDFNKGIAKGDFFVVTVVYADGTTATYFVGAR